MFDIRQMGRRTFLKAVGLTIPALALAPWGCGSHSDGNSGVNAVGSNPIIDENRKSGTTDWIVTVESNAAMNREIEGYASETDINQGDAIHIFVNTAEPTYQLEVFRLGWYGGAGGRRVFGPITLNGIQQAVPIPDPVTGLIECGWKNPFTLETSRDWTTGVYLVKLTANVSHKHSYVPFTLCDGTRSSQILFQNSVTTGQAYNNWGGKSLYGFNSSNAPAIKVSFNRPYANGHGAGDVLVWELSLLRFLEREGYDVGYCTNMTTHRNVLGNPKAILSVGHDEYWSWDMRRNITAARDRGIHLAFFGANCCYWQIRLEPSSLDGQPRRTIVCYKDRFQEDPLFGVDNARVTTLWRDAPVNQPEEQLIGVQQTFDPVHGDVVVSNARHFIFEGTGLKNGDHLPGLLGIEVDRSFGHGPTNLMQLCHSPIPTDGLSPAKLQELTQEEQADPNSGFSEMTIYTAPSGALVFAAGTMQFNWGLDEGINSSHASLVNPAVQRMVRNLFSRFM